MKTIFCRSSDKSSDISEKQVFFAIDGFPNDLPEGELISVLTSFGQLSEFLSEYSNLLMNE